LCLLSLCSTETGAAQILFSRKFDLSAGGGGEEGGSAHVLKPSWTLGWYISAIDSAAGGKEWR
jgi:hypothetical protein